MQPLELELGTAREQLREVRQHAKARERQFEEMLVAADGVKAEVGQLRDRLRSYDALVARARGLEDDNRALEDRVHHLGVQLERERSERAQWARARIELLTQFCDSNAPAVGIADTAAPGANTDEAMLRLLATDGVPKPQPAPLFPPSPPPPHYGGAYAPPPAAGSPTHSVGSRRFDRD